MRMVRIGYGNNNGTEGTTTATACTVSGRTSGDGLSVTPY